ncbi:MAG: DUF4336 domain-containing protein [Holophagales bacterium]|nr:DUF4336 domain-containing protein [Holophagales bacterium]
MNTDTAELAPFAEGVWVGAAPARILGMPLTTTMTVLRLGDGGLLLHSPTAMTPERLSAVRELGRVSHLYAPSLTHQRRIGEWAEAFPQARLHGPTGLAVERPDLRIDRSHGDPMDPEMEGMVEEFPIAGFRLQETVVFYRPARVMIVADLVHNIGRPAHRWTRIYAGLMGFYGRIELSRMLRWIAFDDRRAARASLDRVLAEPFEALIVGHGNHLRTGGREALAAAYAWLT